MRTRPVVLLTVPGLDTHLAFVHIAELSENSGGGANTISCDGDSSLLFLLHMLLPVVVTQFRSLLRQFYGLKINTPIHLKN